MIDDMIDTGGTIAEGAADAGGSPARRKFSLLHAPRALWDGCRAPQLLASAFHRRYNTIPLPEHKIVAK